MGAVFTLRNIISSKPAVEDIVVFVTDLYERGLCYAPRYSARGALKNLIILPELSRYIRTPSH